VQKKYCIQFASAKIEDLMFRTTFDPVTREGEVVVNLSIIDKEDLDDVLGIFKMAANSGLTVSPYIRVLHEGDDVEGISVGPGEVGLITMCSITIDGILLKKGVFVKHRFGGLAEIKDGTPLRFTNVLAYHSTTIDPLEVLMFQEITSVIEVLKTGSGKILANLREAPMAARDDIDRILSDMVDVDITGVLEVGEPNVHILNVPMERDRLGIVAIGGTNPMAIVQEYGIGIRVRTMFNVVDFKELYHISEYM